MDRKKLYVNIKLVLLGRTLHSEQCDPLLCWLDIYAACGCFLERRQTALYQTSMK